MTPAAAQTLGYQPTQFACATYIERSSNDLRSETSGEIRDETIRRVGQWRMKGVAAADGVRIEAWYDSLTLTRRIPDAVITPDTDGLIGGRFTGALSADGRWRRVTVPFVPPSVGEVADVSGAMDELLPRLPAFDLRVGGQWKDGAGLTVTREADSLADGATIVRLHYTRESRDPPPLLLDEVVVGATQHVLADGEIRFSTERGLLRHERSQEVETFVPKGKIFPAPVRTRAIERFVLERMPDGSGDACR